MATLLCSTNPTFFVSDALAQRLPAWPRFTRQEFQKLGVPLSLHDTFATHNVATEPPWVIWLTYRAFLELGRTEQLGLLREQRLFGRGGVVHLTEVAELLESRKLEPNTLDGLFVWWPQLWARLDEAEKRWVLRALVEADRLSCRRQELTTAD